MCSKLFAPKQWFPQFYSIASRIPPGRIEGRLKRWPHNGPKMAKRGPRWPQDGPRWHQDGPKMAPRWPKMPQDGPKLTPEAPKMGPKWPQEGAQIAPKSVFQGLPTSKPKKGVPRPISNVVLGRFGGPLGGHVGPMLGPMRAHKAS